LLRASIFSLLASIAGLVIVWLVGRLLDFVSNSRESQRAYRLLFARVGVRGLPRLQTIHNDSIALQSAWEAVALTVPVEQGKTVYQPDSQELNWFLGFLQARTKVSPPDWWRQVVLRARANRRDNILPDKTKTVPYHLAGIDRVRCPVNAAVEKDGDSLIYRVGADRISIPEEIQEGVDRGHFVDTASGCFTDKRVFLAVHDNIGYPHKVGCIDRSSGKLLWRASACGCWWDGASGHHESWVSVGATDDDRVFVFGAASVGFYLHGFRSSDRRSLVRFSSNF
jgi:hypothetical protein